MKDKKYPDELEKLKKQAEDYLNGWKRAKADLVNYKKDVEKHSTEIREFMAADLILELLPIHNHFKRSFEHIPKEDRKRDWVVGITLIKSQLDKFLQNRGVSEIKTVGEKFNPEFHEAVSKREEQGSQSDIILEECSAGYAVAGKVIVPAKVIVSE